MLSSDQSKPTNGVQHEKVHWFFNDKDEICALLCAICLRRLHKCLNNYQHFVLVEIFFGCEFFSHAFSSVFSVRLFKVLFIHNFCRRTGFRESLFADLQRRPVFEIWLLYHRERRRGGGEGVGCIHSDVYRHYAVRSVPFQSVTCAADYSR
ncbi:hypothetical protein Tcan_01541 [Toxocara canis]|uniref:Uncharacterized protein n=1 Tax=Toxocara canis TaxID=6265 RepID=A0A0B2V4E4_TOXCA|nr:hypothetical protein Tcan_01541 [Toxocara canis]